MSMASQWSRRRLLGLFAVAGGADMAEIKARFGLPPSLASCYASLITGYAIEGHVPMPHVARLLRDKPEGVHGIAVPGMPRGSPGMEMADGREDAFEVMAFDREGRVSVFSA